MGRKALPAITTTTISTIAVRAGRATLAGHREEHHSHPKLKEFRHAVSEDTSILVSNWKIEG